MTPEGTLRRPLTVAERRVVVRCLPFTRPTEVASLRFRQPAGDGAGPRRHRRVGGQAWRAMTPKATLRRPLAAVAERGVVASHWPFTRPTEVAPLPFGDPRAKAPSRRARFDFADRRGEP